jgi:hypothetical protein
LSSPTKGFSAVRPFQLVNEYLNDKNIGTINPIVKIINPGKTRVKY